jgi:hypothetical protein
VQPVSKREPTDAQCAARQRKFQGQIERALAEGDHDKAPRDVFARRADGVMTPKRLQGRSPSHARARAQERAAANIWGGCQTKGSGASYEKGDVRAKGLARVECKHTVHDSFRVTAEMVDKIEAATFGANEVPVIEIELSAGKRRVCVVPSWAMQMIAEVCS